MLTIKVKKEIIIEKHEHGVHVMKLHRHYKKSLSTICIILKKKEDITG